MNKLKIGILSYYYDSFNYGGLLQAYALTKFLNQYDNFVAEQICYKVSCNINDNNEDRVGYFKKIVAAVYHFPQRLDFYCGKKNVEQNLIQRMIKIKQWRDCIPHSERIFTIDSIDDSTKYYDYFITGSDQVWNMRWSDSSFFLNFVPNSKGKCSYGASVGSDVISAELKNLLVTNVSEFNGISVREESTKQIISDICHREVETVVDPTLLLTREQWDDVCSERRINQRYIFCYFLGNDSNMRKIVKQFAQGKKINVVSIPHAPLDYMPCDKRFADVPLYDVDPSDFISLIKHADYIFTDSFHAAVFSNIYQKRFIVFTRNGMSEMGNRIENLCALFNNRYRFYHESVAQDIDRIKSIIETEPEDNNSAFLREREKSVTFLKKYLGNIYERL